MSKETLKTTVIDIDTNKSERSNVPNGIELKIDKTLQGETKNGLPFQFVSVGEEEQLGKDATVQKGVYILAPTPEFASALLDKPEKRKVSTGKAAIAAAVLGAVAAGGCLNGNGDTGSAGDNAFDQMHKKMSLPADIDHFSSKTTACFTEGGDKKPNIGTYNGETVVTFIRNDGVDHCYYVKATDLQTALEGECSAQLITLPGNQPGDPPIYGCAVHPNTNNDTIYYKRGGEGVLEADLTNGGPSLTASNYQYVPPGIITENISIIQDGGTDYILAQDGTNIRKYSLLDGTEEITPIPDDCGIPHLDPDTGVWVGSRFDNYAGPVECRIVKSTTLNGLASSLQFVPNIMNNGGTLEGNATNPRIMGEIMVFEGEEDVASVLQPSKIYYAIVMEYCGDTVCNNGETQANCATDCGTAPACGDGNLDAGEACDDGAANSDTAADACRTTCELPSCGDDVTDTDEECDDGNTLDGDGCSAVCETETTEPVCGDGTCEVPETNATCPTDCPPGPVCGDNICETPETNATCATDCALDPSCQPFMDDSRIRFVQGAENCELTDCVDTPLEELLTVQGECTFELDFGNTNPAEVTIAGANGSADGAYRIDFIEEMGEMLRGQYYVDDNGNSLGTTYTKNGNKVATVVEGTKYGGEEITIPENSHDGYRLECSEGQITVYKNGELVTTLNANDSTIVDMEENETDPDAGVDGGVDSGTDGGADAGVDAGTTPPSKPGCGESCSTSGDKLPAGELAFIGLMLLALGRKMRRAREESIMENRPTAPGGILLNHVKRSVGKYFEGLGK